MQTYSPVIDGPAEIERCSHCGHGSNAHGADRKCPPDRECERQAREKSVLHREG